jgi:hypothetical protein
MINQKWADYIGKTIYAKYAVERNIDGADVPVIREGEVTPYLDPKGWVFLDTEYGVAYPFFETFELIK